MLRHHVHHGLRGVTTGGPAYILNRHVFGIQTSDLVTIALLVVLEGILSADNAMVLAIRVLSLPKNQQVKALRYGMASAFTFRATATALAAYLIALGWVKLVGGLYLLYLPFQHFRGHAATPSHATPSSRPSRGWGCRRSGPRSSRSS